MILHQCETCTNAATRGIAGGTVANTTHAHRLIQHYQETKGPEVADKIINSLYKQYFEEERHPSSDETLLRAATEAGIDEKEAKGKPIVMP